MDTEECFLDLEDEDDGDGDRESLSDRKLRKLCFLHKCLGVLNRAAIMSGGVGISSRELSTQLINSLEQANHSFS